MKEIERILVIPDTQVKPGVPLDHFRWIGNYIVAKQPEVIVHIGDFADMPSLSSYDQGKKSFEGRRYIRDVESVIKAQEILFEPLRLFNRSRKESHKSLYRPKLILTLGNHEQRINRAVDDDPKLEGVISVDDLKYNSFGWEVHGYLEVIIIGGVAFSHYFTSGILGRPVTSPQALLAKKHMSCVMGHVQVDGIASQYRADGKRITAIFAGSCYLHDEEYLNPQGNKTWKGIWMLHDVRDGEFDVMPVSLNYLGKKYAY